MRETRMRGVGRPRGVVASRVIAFAVGALVGIDAHGRGRRAARGHSVGAAFGARHARQPPGDAAVGRAGPTSTATR